VVAREAIEAFLLETPATMLVVSHDRRFLETVCERLWVVDDGQVAPFDGGYRAWRSAIADGWTVAGAIEQEARRLQPGARGGRAGVSASSAAAAGKGAGHGPGAGAGTTAGAPAGRSSSNGTEAGAAPAVASPPRPRQPKLSKDAYRRQRESVDAELTRLGLRRNHLELELGKPAVQANFIELRRVTSELADVETALAAAEDAWLQLEERAP
jgi:energy-coupling factor transporter ATP-binding protein EcfA2